MFMELSRNKRDECRRGEGKDNCAIFEKATGDGTRSKVERVREASINLKQKSKRREVAW